MITKILLPSLPVYEIFIHPHLFLTRIVMFPTELFFSLCRRKTFLKKRKKKHESDQVEKPGANLQKGTE